jgi:hypothetical protein
MKGKDLLGAPRIRAIVGDLARHLRTYHTQLEKLKTEADEMAVDDAQKDCLRKISSIVPHHCNEHSLCSVEDCKYLEIERAVRCAHEVMLDYSAGSQVFST